MSLLDKINEDLKEAMKQKELKKIGYSLFIYLHKKVPKGVKKIDREFEFNWDISEIL